METSHYFTQESDFEEADSDVVHRHVLHQSLFLDNIILKKNLNSIHKHFNYYKTTFLLPNKWQRNIWQQWVEFGSYPAKNNIL